MGKVAFLFPGQGSQTVGMAKDFYEAYPACREVFDLASEESGLDVGEICFQENERIHRTEYTQIALMAAQIAILRAVEESGARADLTAGLSLGEYGALVVSGVLSAAEVFRVARKRGIVMQEACARGGAMAAVLGPEAGLVEEICRRTPGQVFVANYNCPGETVITGETEAVSKAIEALDRAGAKRCVPLKVSGPFHSPLLAEAGRKLGEVLKEVPLGEIQVPYLSSVTGDYVTSKDQIKGLLIRQVSSPVLWQQCMERMIADGTDVFVEIGPGRSLARFLRRIDRNVTAISVEKVEDLGRLGRIKALSGA